MWDHSISQAPMHQYFACAIKLIAEPKVILMFLFSSGFLTAVALFTLKVSFLLSCKFMLGTYSINYASLLIMDQ